MLLSCVEQFFFFSAETNAEVCGIHKMATCLFREYGRLHRFTQNNPLQEKKMVDVHFTTMSLTQPIKYKESQIFAIFVPVLTTLCVLDLEIFMYVFMSIVSSCAKNYG